MFKQMRMGHKLWLAVVVIVVLLAAVVGFSGYRSAKVQAEAEAMAEDMTNRVQAAPVRWSRQCVRDGRTRAASSGRPA